jgi:ketosteroid isomerase-like protein
MTYVLTFSSLVLVVMLSTTVATNQDGRPEQPEQDRAALAQIQQDLAKAWVSGDRATIERIIAPEWRSTGPDGRSSDRASVLADVFEKRVHTIRRLEIDDVRVQVFGDAAVVTGRTHGTGDFAGRPYDVVIRFTDTFVRRANRWQAVASHSSLEAPR